VDDHRDDRGPAEDEGADEPWVIAWLIAGSSQVDPKGVCSSQGRPVRRLAAASGDCMRKA
ncbi:MAG: hypothetical protein ACOVK7_05245, partial [Burkholderiaceae bacterium]